MPEIVVGVDGSPNSLAALRWARAEALRRDANVVAVFAWGFIPPGHAGDGHTFDTAYGSSEAHAALAATVEAAVGADAATAVEGCVVYEVAPRALLRLAARAELLVVGARGVGGFGGLRLGSVSEQCLHHTSVPLVIVRSDAIAGGLRRDARIVVGVDGSESAQRAVTWAIDEARLRGARLEAVHAWSSLYPVAAPTAGVPALCDALEAEARVQLDRTLAAEDTGGLAAPVSTRVVPGAAAPAILDAARGADLVVLGSRGRGGFAGLLLGSVTHHLAHHCPCPLVVVP